MMPVSSYRPRPEDRLDATKKPAQAVNLLCEYVSNPIGIDSPLPHFSWGYHAAGRDFKQRAYRIMVSTSKEGLEAGCSDVWDSGRVDSAGSLNVEYEGRPLESFGAYWWTVRVWDQLDREGPDAEAGYFEMGIMEQSNWRGHWIGPGIPFMTNRMDDEIRDVLWAPLLRKEIIIERKIKKARAYISGLGWSEVYINGEKVGRAVLDPSPTDYHKSVPYRIHDLAQYLREGQNVIGLILGNGWYSEPRWRQAYAESPRALVYIRIEGEDGEVSEVISDDTWSVASGPILENRFWGGEVYDARLEKPGWSEPGYDEGELLENLSTKWHRNRGDTDYLDGKWRKAVINERPEGLLKAQLLPEMRVNEEPELISFIRVAENIWICEMGEFYGGWIRLRVRGRAGTEVKIRYSGRLGEDGRILPRRGWSC